MFFGSPIPWNYCCFIVLCSSLVNATLQPSVVHSLELQLATFEIEASPPVGSPLCDGLVPPAIGVADPLTARGVVLLPAGERPIVLVAIDWVGIGNGGQDEWRQALAKAANTSMDRICIHTLHQHDAPGCDFTAERIAADAGISEQLFPVEFARKTIVRASQALRKSLVSPVSVTHMAYGRGEVERVASNRRLLGPDGKVQHIRYSSCRDPVVRAMPEGVVDQFVNCISFWAEDKPLVVLTYYATHPQSYYATGLVSADFVGLARTIRERSMPNVAHIHFNGAGGNVAAGKYNDGSPKNRAVLAQRLADGMKKAWQNSNKLPLDLLEFDWAVRSVQLPISATLNKQERLACLEDTNAPSIERLSSARDLAWIERTEKACSIDVARLRLGEVNLLHLPGELFVEYQLLAKRLCPAGFVCVAAYGDYGPGYIGTELAYAQGGYETGPVSRVGPRVEQVLNATIHELLSQE